MEGGGGGGGVVQKKEKEKKHPCDPAAIHRGTAFQTSCLEDF